MPAPVQSTRTIRFFAYFDTGRTWQERLSWVVSIVTAVTGTSLIAFFGISGDLPIVWLSLIWLGDIALISIACSVAKTANQRMLPIAFVIAIAILATGIVFRQQHNREGRDRIAAAKAADDYIITYDQPDYHPVLLAGQRGPHGGPMMVAMTVGWVFDNPNDFDVWVKSFRRHVEIEGRGSGNEEQIAFTKVPRGARGLVVSDLTIRFDKPVEL